MSYWKANPHQWGKGRTHLMHSDGTKTLCGRKLTDCPGQYVPENEYDCQGCAKALATQEQRRLQEEQWRIQQEQWKREQEERDRRRELNRGQWRMPWGKYQDMDFVDIPDDYFHWLLNQAWLHTYLRIRIEAHLHSVGEI